MDRHTTTAAVEELYIARDERESEHRIYFERGSVSNIPMDEADATQSAITTAITAEQRSAACMTMATRRESERERARYETTKRYFRWSAGDIRPPKVRTNRNIQRKLWSLFSSLFVSASFHHRLPSLACAYPACLSACLHIDALLVARHSRGHRGVGHRGLGSMEASQALGYPGSIASVADQLVRLSLALSLCDVLLLAHTSTPCTQDSASSRA